MKPKSKKAFLWCLYITLIMIFPRLDMQFDIDYYIFTAAFVASISFIYFIPKKIIGVSLAAVVTAGVSLYQYHYCFYSLPALLLFCAHKEAVLQNSKSKKDKYHISIIFSILSIVSLIPQLIYAEENKTNVGIKDGIADFIYIICYLVLFVMLLIVSFRSKSTYRNPIKKGVANSLKLFYIGSVICICSSVYTVAARVEAGTISNKVEFVYWFIFVIMIILDSDPFLNVLIDKFDALAARKIPENNKVKK